CATTARQALPARWSPSSPPTATLARAASTCKRSTSTTPRISSSSPPRSLHICDLRSSLPRRPSGCESLEAPVRSVSGVAKAVVQAVLPALPELHDHRCHSVTAPVRGARDRRAGEPRLDFVVSRVELGS